MSTITSVDLVDNSWGFEGNGYVPGATVRIFYDHFDFASGTANSAIPPDAVIKCPLSNCSAPTIITRGQPGAMNFADDGTAIYWTASGQASNVAIWKVAK